MLAVVTHDSECDLHSKTSTLYPYLVSFVPCVKTLLPVGDMDWVPLLIPAFRHAIGCVPLLGTCYLRHALLLLRPDLLVPAMIPSRHGPAPH